MAIDRDDFPLPDLTDERTAPFFEAAARGELGIPRCDRCVRLVWYPADTCPTCGAEAFTWVATSGRGAVYTWTTVRRAFLPAFDGMVPYTTAIVALDDDPRVRIVSYLVDADPDGLTAEQPVEAVFRPLSFATLPGREVVVPMWTPA
jgi:uncharacterized OB-fold protein